MGVPAFFRYMSEKYPKIIQHLIEDRGVDGDALAAPIPQFDTDGYEFDALYIDMNGIIHPCAHPEDRPAPTSELEMYHNITVYVDRLFAAIRPKKLLYLAIDGVAPRAKMNQQRSRRFRAAQDAAERNAIMKDIRRDIGGGGDFDDDDDDISFNPEGGKKGEWDSNVITPGTPFMHNLSDYLRWYVIDRLNRGGEAWRRCTVIFSDASEPGEGEHKIMNFIRRQRTLPGYDPNLRHVLHGLDADLIMLGLALHEAHFTVLREEVRFGREAHSQSKASADQDTFDKLKGNGGILAVAEDARWCYGKPFVMCHVATLREYLAVEFGQLATVLPFEFDFERIVDDFVFLCFFVGNDFLPHLPTLDIRDGAIDFLYNVYKRVLPTLGDYLTRPGGHVNLENVDVVLAEVGAIEDEVFKRRKGADDADKTRNAQMKARKQVGIPGGEAGIERLQMIAGGQAFSAVPVGVPNRHAADPAPPPGPPPSAQGPLPPAPASTGAQEPEGKNQSAAAALRASLLGGSARAKAPAVKSEQPDHRCDAAPVAPEPSAPPPAPTSGAPVREKKTAEEKAANAAAAEAAYKAKSQAMLDEYKEKIEDEVRFWEAGWKDRYYADKYKEKDIASGGGRERVFREYIRGLCWVMKYYYDGCASWKWYYPFHYAPFASDLRNIERYADDWGESEPFKPIEQLMAVLPKESHHALPQPCHDLMLKPDSPIADFYPEEVEIDPNGKAMPWLWVALLPFIDEERLLANLAKVYPKFDDAARDRNRFRTATIFVHASNAALGRAVAARVEAGPGADTLDVSASDGFVGGAIAVPDAASDPHGFACHVRRAGAKVTAPLEPKGVYEDLPNNQAVAACYENPPHAVHVSALLAGAVLPPAKLGLYDMQIRIPRINRGMSISDLGLGPNGQRPAHAQAGLPQHPMGKGFGRGGGNGGQGGQGNGGGPFQHQRQSAQSLPPAKRGRVDGPMVQTMVGVHQQPLYQQPQHILQHQVPQGYQQPRHHQMQQQGFQQQHQMPPQGYQQQVPPPGYPQQQHNQMQQRGFQQQHQQMPPQGYQQQQMPPQGYQHHHQMQQMQHQGFQHQLHHLPPQHSFQHPQHAPPPAGLDALRAGLAQTLLRRPPQPPNMPFQHNR